MLVKKGPRGDNNYYDMDSMLGAMFPRLCRFGTYASVVLVILDSGLDAIHYSRRSAGDLYSTNQHACIIGTPFSHKLVTVHQ